MLSKRNRHWTLLLAGGVVLLLMVVGCGGSSGGGGGDNLDYQGNREAAEITSDNAQELAASAYDSSSLEGPFGAINSLTDSTSTAAVVPHGRPAMLGVSQALETALLKADPGAVAGTAASRAVVNVSETISGACGGSASFSIEADDSTGRFSGSFTFNSYCEDDTTLDGRASFQGRIDPQTEALQSFTFSFSSLSGSGDGESYRLNGSMGVSVDAADNRTVLTMDLLFEDTVADETLWLRDFRISVTERSAYDEIDISGRIYHPVHGYVDIHTDSAFRVYSGDDYPSQGVFSLTGADNATIQMTVISNLQYQVVADLDGDGDNEWGPETHSWAE